VEGALDAGAVVGAGLANVVDDELGVVLGDLIPTQHHFAAGYALQEPPEVHHDPEEVGPSFQGSQLLAEPGGSASRVRRGVGDDLFNAGEVRFWLRRHGYGQRERVQPGPPPPP
jgi:hypothetical protein